MRENGEWQSCQHSVRTSTVGSNMIIKWLHCKQLISVYFRKRFPSIYRGDILSEEEVLDWLRKNRFRQPELNLFMYALIAIAVGFVLYTAFLLQCFKPAPAPPKPPKDPKEKYWHLRKIDKIFLTSLNYFLSNLKGWLKNLSSFI